MPIKSQMSSIMGQIELERPELFALEFGKIAESDFVYTLASTNIDFIEWRFTPLLTVFQSYHGDSSRYS